MTGRVVVGVGTPEASRAPLEWAVHEAATRGADLTVLHAFEPGYVISPEGIPGPAVDLAPYEARAKAVIDDAIEVLPFDRRAEARHAQRIATPGGAAGVLVDAGRDADLLVVGRRERRALPRLLGSVAHQCVHHAPCPITVVPIDWAFTPPARVVVGVDGSASSKAALRWAMEEAELHDVELVVAHAWETPYPVEPWGLVVTPRDREVFRDGARLLIDGMVKDAVADGAPEPCEWTGQTIEDASGAALVHAADEDDLLVVGSRGRGGFKALLLGSTSLQCVHHARCPVTVVRPLTEGAAE